MLKTVRFRKKRDLEKSYFYEALPSGNMGFFPEEAGGCIRTFSPRGKYFVGALLPAVRYEFKLFTNRPPLEYAIIRVQWPTVGCSPDNLINFFTRFS